MEIVQISSQKKSPGYDGLMREFYWAFKVLKQILFNIFQKIEEEETFPNSFHEASITLIPKTTNIGKQIGKTIDQSLINWKQKTSQQNISKYN